MGLGFLKSPVNTQGDLDFPECMAVCLLDHLSFLPSIILVTLPVPLMGDPWFPGRADLVPLIIFCHSRCTRWPGYLSAFSLSLPPSSAVACPSFPWLLPFFFSPRVQVNATDPFRFRFLLRASKKLGSPCPLLTCGV